MKKRKERKSRINVFPFLLVEDQMREFYERCTIIYDDYRTAIPPYAAAALSFYLLLLLIPAFTLIAIGTSLFNIDMTVLQNIIEQFVVKEYAQMLIEILESRSFNTVALVTILVSIYTVSTLNPALYQPWSSIYLFCHSHCNICNHRNSIIYFFSCKCFC